MYSACTNPSINSEQTLASLNKVIDDIGGWPLINRIPKTKIPNFWDFVGDLTAKYGIQFFFNFEVGPYAYDTNVQSIRVFIMDYY